MVPTAGGWERYQRWNAAIAQVVYPRSAEGTPVYLDLEDDVLAAIRDIAEPSATDPSAALVETVKNTLDLGRGPTDTFGGHLHRLATWRRDARPNLPPPTLGVLALLSLAAENMHEGEGRAANNFYGRLGDLLGITDTQVARLTHAYRRRTADGRAVSEVIWDSLNTWLERLEGFRGIPTAFALAHTHIGLPLSQALVRDTDREKFGDMFTTYGLPPHGSLASDEMERVIDEWLTRKPCPASNSLERMWARDSTARERIVEVAQLTLETWDGPDDIAGAADPSAPIDSVRVKATIRSFPARRLVITLVLPARSGADGETIEVLGADNETIGSLDLVPAASGWLTLADPSDIDAASFLGGEARLRRPARSHPLRRKPRQLIPMRRDNMLQGFVECERVQLGEDALILVRSRIAPKVAHVLSVAARPGFVKCDSLAGLPDGWTLFDKVQILSSIPDEELRNQLVDLNLLQPLASSQVVLQGGMRIPGNLRKWSTALPPELRASALESGAISALISCISPLVSPTPPDVAKSIDAPVLIWDLAELTLPDGDYRIDVSRDDGSLMKSEVLRLRSADNPALALFREESDPLAHDPLSGAFALSACHTRDPDAFRGVPMSGTTVELPSAQLAHPPLWFGARKISGQSTEIGVPVAFPRAGDQSCMVTGAHHMLVDTAMQGASSVEGACKYCGLVKRYPTRGRHRRSSRDRTREEAPVIDVHELGSVKGTEAVDWSAGFDALCHIGGGRTSALVDIASQMEEGGLFADAFVRRLEGLGHIELERDPMSLLATAWEVIDPILVGLPDGSFVAIGFRSEHMMVAIEDGVHAAGGCLSLDRSVNAPPVVRISGLADEDLRRLADAMQKATGRPVAVVPRAADRLVGQLPTLSQVVESLPTVPMPGARRYERWNSTTARFELSIHADGPGSFRLSGFVRAYIYRRPEDVALGKARLGDARVVKYAAALDSGRPLTGYDPSACVLYVPLGADLPGLFGRAAMLATGSPPIENASEQILEYHGVTPALAGQLAARLMS